MLRCILPLVLCCGLLIGAAKPKITLPKIYDHWLKEEVTYIITEEETKEFLKLSTDESRDKFIGEFWEVRNPIRGAAINSYREEHYKRLAFANDTFGHRSNTPGWRTDMGRAWILFGKPDSRAPYLGYGQLYPLELWSYSNKFGDPALPSFFKLLFFMPEDAGEFRFYRPSLDTPLKLVRGSQFNTNADVYKFLRPIAGDLAHAAFSLVSGDPIDSSNFTVDMSSDIMISKIQNLANDQFNLRRLRELRALRVKVDSVFLVNQDQPLVINSLVVPDPTGQFWLDFSVPVGDQALGKADPEGKQLSLLSSFRLLTEAGEPIVENEEERAYKAFGPDGKFLPFQIAGRLPVLPGNYKLEFRVVDRTHSRAFHGEKNIRVAAPGVVAMDGPLLFSAANRIAQPDSAAPFQYFSVQFQPLAAAAVRSEPLHLLYTLQLPPEHVQDFTVEYLIAHTQDHDSRMDLKDTISAGAFRDGRLVQSKTISISDLAPGPYRIVVAVRAPGSLVTVASAAVSTRIGDAIETEPLYFLESARNTSSPAGSAYIRALEAIAWKEQAAAIRYMKLTLDANPGNVFAGRFLVEKWFEAHQFTPVVELYRKLGMKPFESSAESLAQISLSFARTGDRKEAQEIVTSARAIFPNNPLLLAVLNAISK